MKIAIVGPIGTKHIAHLLAGDATNLPEGIPGAPLLATLIETLIERGHEVVAVTLSRGLPLDMAQALVATGPSFRIRYVPVRQHSMRFNGRYLGRIVDLYALERRRLADVLQTEQPDVVHAHWSYETALAAEASGLPYVVTCHDSPLQVLRFMTNLYRFGRLLMARQALRRAPVVTAVSAYLKDEVQGFCRVPVRVIPNPMPAQLLSMPSRPPIAYVELATTPRVAAISNGGWDGLKNAKPGLEAFALLKKRFPQANLHLYGYDFAPGEPAETFARARGLAEGMVFHGQTHYAELLQQLSSMHLLLHPSLEESLGMVLVEAMAVGAVAIGGQNSGAVPWVLDGGKAGILADVTSAEELARAMIELLKDPLRYAALSQAGQQRARSVFEPHAVAAAYEQCYRDAVSLVWQQPDRRASLHNQAQ